MSGDWERVRLSNILTLSDERVELDDLTEYITITVKRRHGGLEEREKLLGHQIATKKQFKLIPGAFIISRVQCWHQAYAIIPPNVPENMIASSNYDQYIISSEVDPKFFWWFSHSPEFTETVRSSAFGVVIEKMVFNRDVWLEKTIPLPPLDEQRRIVTHIEALAARIAEARGLRQGAVGETQLLLRAIIRYSAEERYRLTPLSELVSLRKCDILVEPNETYHFAGVFSFGRGVFAGSIKKGSEFKYAQLTRLKQNNFVYPKLMAWEGALGVVPPECEGMVVSPEFPVFDVNEKVVLPEVLDVYFKTPDIWPLIASLSTGTNVRRRRLHPKAFLTFQFPLPPMEVQMQLRAAKEQISRIQSIRQDFLAELDGLLPSILDRAFKGEL